MIFLLEVVASYLNSVVKVAPFFFPQNRGLFGLSETSVWLGAYPESLFPLGSARGAGEAKLATTLDILSERKLLIRPVHYFRRSKFFTKHTVASNKSFTFYKKNRLWCFVSNFSLFDKQCIEVNKVQSSFYASMAKPSKDSWNVSRKFHQPNEGTTHRVRCNKGQVLEYPRLLQINL